MRYQIGELPAAARRADAAGAGRSDRPSLPPNLKGGSSPKAGAMIWMRIGTPITTNRTQFAYHSCLW